jgi:hypothetical protein
MGSTQKKGVSPSPDTSWMGKWADRGKKKQLKTFLLILMSFESIGVIHIL